MCFAIQLNIFNQYNFSLSDWSWKLWIYDISLQSKVSFSLFISYQFRQNIYFIFVACYYIWRSCFPGKHLPIQRNTYPRQIICQRRNSRAAICKKELQLREGNPLVVQHLDVVHEKVAASRRELGVNSASRPLSSFRRFAFGPCSQHFRESFATAVVRERSTTWLVGDAMVIYGGLANEFQRENSAATEK